MCIRDSSVLVNQASQVETAVFCDGEVNAGPVFVRKLLKVFPNKLKILQTINSDVKIGQRNFPVAHQLDGLHHLIGVHGLSLQEKQNQHFCGCFFQGFSNPIGSARHFISLELFSLFHDITQF